MIASSCFGFSFETFADISRNQHSGLASNQSQIDAGVSLDEHRPSDRRNEQFALNQGALPGDPRFLLFGPCFAARSPPGQRLDFIHGQRRTGREAVYHEQHLKLSDALLYRRSAIDT